MCIHAATTIIMKIDHSSHPPTPTPEAPLGLLVVTLPHPCGRPQSSFCYCRLDLPVVEIHIWNLWLVASLSHHNNFEIYPSDMCSFLSLSISSPLCRNNKICLPIHLLVDLWVLFSCFINKAKIIYKPLCGWLCLSFSWVAVLGKERLTYIRTACLTL